MPRDQPSTRAAAAPAAAAGAPRAAAGEKASKAADKENRETAATDEVTKAEKVEASRKASGASFAAALGTATGAELPPPTMWLDADDAAALPFCQCCFCIPSFVFGYGKLGRTVG